MHDTDPPRPRRQGAARRGKRGTAAGEEPALWQALLDTVPEGVLVIDAGGIIRSFSAAAERLFGCAAAEAIGTSVNRFMPSPHRERHDGYLERYLKTGERHIIGTRRVVVARRSDGGTFPVELFVGEVASGGRPLFIGFLRDLSERQQHERHMRDLQAELANMARLSELAQMGAALAHELNQPLTAISNYVKALGLMAASADPALAARASPIVDKTAEQARRASDIVRRMRDFTKKTAPDTRVENLLKVMEEASALGLVGARERGIRIELSVDPAACCVFVDKVQIQQVLVNLMRNAVEAMEGAERRELTLAAVPRAAEGLIEVSVADTGPGLASDVAGRLFQLFLTTKPQGMGIGLSICRSIVEAHGGRIWAEANPGGGTVFRFTLRAAPAPEADTV